MAGAHRNKRLVGFCGAAPAISVNPESETEREVVYQAQKVVP